MRRLMAVVMVLGFAACGSDSKDAAPTTGERTETTAAVAVVETTDVATTTVETEPETTAATEPVETEPPETDAPTTEATDAPTTTADESLNTISRATAVAVNACFDGWLRIAAFGDDGFYESAVDEAIPVCEEAKGQVDVDQQIGATGQPLKDLNFILSSIALKLSLLNLDASIGQCSGGLCTASSPDAFLIGELASVPGVFNDQPTISTTWAVTDVAGIVIAG